MLHWQAACIEKIITLVSKINEDES